MLGWAAAGGAVSCSGVRTSSCACTCSKQRDTVRAPTCHGRLRDRSTGGVCVTGRSANAAQRAVHILWHWAHRSTRPAHNACQGKQHLHVEVEGAVLSLGQVGGGGGGKFRRGSLAKRTKQVVGQRRFAALGLSHLQGRTCELLKFVKCNVMYWARLAPTCATDMLGGCDGITAQQGWLCPVRQPHGLDSQPGC